MKTFHLTPFNIISALALLFFLPSCVTVPGTWKNERISSGKRDDFHDLNKEVLGYLKANDATSLKTVFSKDMNASNNAREIEHISNRLTDNEFQLLDEFYVVHKYKDTDTVRSTGVDINRYGLVYPYVTTETYLAFFVPKKADNKYMVSLIYGKFDYGWKIVKLNVEPYTINGKTAPELYAMAQDQYDKKEIQAALDNVSLAVGCYKPGEYWQYATEEEAGRFYTKVHTEVDERYRYPLVLKQVATGPMILRVYNKIGDDGAYPNVYYMTHYNLKDTVAVKKENMQIRTAVSKLMPGLGDNSKYVLYSAFNQKPNGYTSVDHFDMQAKAH